MSTPAAGEVVPRATRPYRAADGLVRVHPGAGDGDAAGPEDLTPALVWVHGGGFIAGGLDVSEVDWIVSSLADRGVTVVSVDYRLAGDGCHYPAPSDDVITAWRWTLEHADALGIDPARLALGGASAGANLVAGAVLRLLDPATAGSGPDGSAAAGSAAAASGPDGTAVAPRTTLPAGVFLSCPTLLAEQPAPDAALRALLDANPQADAFGPAAVRAMYETYLGGPIEDAPLAVVPGRASAAQLAGFPPVLMINDEIDELRVSGELFAATLLEAGVPLELAVAPGTQHGHLNRPELAAASDSLERVMRWFGRRFIPAPENTTDVAAAATDLPITDLSTTEGILR